MLASESSTDVETLQMGWALSKAHAGSIRFSREVKEYLTAKFETGERTGRKADSVQVEKDMRTARNVNARVQFNEFLRSVGSWEGPGNCSSVAMVIFVSAFMLS